MGNTDNSRLITEPSKVFTTSEALEYKKIKEGNITTKPPIKWISVKTGKPVLIGGK